MNVLSYAKRLTALILCAVLLLGLMPLGAFATEAEGETTAPTGETTAPVAETTAPTDETTAPADETTAPAEETTAPVDETIVPIEEVTAPTVGEINTLADEPVAQANEDGTLTFPSATTTYTENVYVLVNSVTSGKQYLLVNANSGSGVALVNNNGTISKVNVTVLNGTDGEFIVLNDATAVWTASDGIVLTNNGSVLGINQTGSIFSREGELALNGSYQSWIYQNNRLYQDIDNCGSVYLAYSNDAWTISQSQQSVYLYEYQEGGTTVTTPEVTYGVNVATADGAAGSYTAQYVTSETTLALTASVGTNPTGYEANAAGGTYAWTSSNEEVATVAADGTLSFTGKGGTTTVRATYTLGEYVIWGEIIITAEPAGYKLQIVDAEGNSLDGTVAVKGDTAIAAGLDLDALVTYEASAEDIREITDATVVWTVSDESIASITDGALTFTGKEGVITVTATYTDPNGEVHTDTLNVSVSKSEYFTPNDGTNDFPEYPNEGAIRIDKNAQAVGNFSETGVAKVELSMTGVPYSVGNEIDVVIMIDMSTSMTEDTNGVADRVTPARTSAVNALEAIVKNEDGTINNNRVAVYTFNGYDNNNPQNYANAVDEILTLKSYQNTSNKNDTTNLTDAQAEINNWIKEANTDSGTNYGAALEKCYSVLKAAKEEYPDRKQFVIFVTDGEPTTGFAYETEDGGVADDGYDSDYSSGAADVYYTKTEYYSKKMREAGVEVYSVGIQLTNDNANTILKKIGGNSTGTAYANADTHGDYAQFINADESADKLITIFEGIVNAIKEAATNVTVTDKITDEYTLILNAPTGVALPEGTELTIDVLEYTLDENKNRSGDPVVIESIALGSDKVTTDDDGNITYINADTFTYDAATHLLTLKADKLDTKELALSYYLYLENSAGTATENQTAAGTYPTNEYAEIEYTNHLDHLCKKEFPVPQLTWNGAQVSYTFYLVNSNGQPVNRAGRVIPFAEAIYVTEIYTESVTWDTDEDKALSAEKIAAELLPEVYTLYDPNTAYTINVYEDEEGKDLGNHFIIAADKTTTSAGVVTSTTKVFNTKAGTIYSAPGTYTATNVHTGFDFANTTVAFAVVWKDELAADTVIVDYGLDVVIDVTTNDALEAKVVGVRADAPANVTINSGNYSAAKAQQAEVKLGDALMGIASVESQTSVRFSMNQANGMQFTEPVKFYYESEASYYNSSNVMQTVYLYSSVTVIPATTIYYEDEYVTLKTIEVTYAPVVYDENSDSTVTYYAIVNGGYTPVSKPVVGETYYVTTESATDGWLISSVDSTAVQDQDRPGESKISDDLDADNNYGYDSAYATMSEHSLGGAAKIKVDEDTRGEAYFTFYGTGFDVIGLTSNTTGTLTVQVYKGAEASGSAVKTLIVDTYYGYTLNDAGEWVIEANNPNALYQVPVMKVTDLEYAMYTVKIMAGYNSFFDHNTADAGYDLYLDAVRIYNPTGNQNKEANDAYVADGEGWPQYIELRNNIIAAAGVTTAEDGTVTIPEGATLSGAVFIDGTGTPTVADYVSYGPNNEVYLAQNQAIAFNVTINEYIADIQLGIKVGNGGPITYTINGDEYTVKTTTDMYYSILDYAKNADGQATTVTITNTSGGILSLTNIKITYTQNPEAASAVATLYIDEEAATAAVMSLRKAPVVEEPEETVPEETVPETTVPEETEPETTVPEETEPETTVPEETEPEETEPSEEDVVEEVVKVVEKIVKKFFGWIFG